MWEDQHFLQHSTYIEALTFHGDIIFALYVTERKLVGQTILIWFSRLLASNEFAQRPQAREGKSADLTNLHIHSLRSAKFRLNWPLLV